MSSLVPAPIELASPPSPAPIKVASTLAQPVAQSTPMLPPRGLNEFRVGDEVWVSDDPTGDMSTPSSMSQRLGIITTLCSSTWYVSHDLVESRDRVH
jgi:hypothetical protein